MNLKSAFNANTRKYINVLIHDTGSYQRINREAGNEFKSDMKYIMDKHMQMNNNLLDKHVKWNTMLLGFGFGAMGIGFTILYNKSEQDKNALNDKIDRNTTELHTKIDRNTTELHTKIDRNTTELNAINTKIDQLLAGQTKNRW
jgi:lantibiotic modifying enzyme